MEIGSLARWCMAGHLALAGGAAVAEVRTYGSFVHHSDLPAVLFMTGEIESGDSFALRRAMRDNPVDLVVAASPGGLLYEGLQIAAILHDNRIGAYVPERASCESACAFVFLGGYRRMVVGELGVHQFYSGEPEADASERVTTALTQYTTSEVIGIMNQFDTPPFVYEKMFGTVTMYYFSATEKPRLNRNVEDEAYLARLAAVDAFLARTPTAVERPAPEPDLASPPPAEGPAEPQAPPHSPPAATWERMPNVDFFGMDIDPSGHRNVSIDACDRICRSDPNCAAWSYVTATRWCWPKSGVSNVSYAEGTVSMVVDGSRISPGILDRPFLEITGKDIAGYDIFPRGLRDTTLEQCRAACEFGSSCRAFTWIAARNWCFPKYGIGRLTDQTGVISGVKKSP